MRITKEVDYAIRIVDYLTRKGSLASSSEISEKACVPLRFAKNILQGLARSGIIDSYKGANGGYDLGRLAKDISLYDVLEAINGPLVLNSCQEHDYMCTYLMDGQCTFNKIFKELTGEIEKKMRGINFAAVVRDNPRDLKTK